MPSDDNESLFDLLGFLSPAHPWHGIDVGPEAPAKLTAFIEIVPTDTVKYELDKASGFLKVDRPQKFSNICPALYGFIPRTYCGDEVGKLSGERAGLKEVKGDRDPMDICVLAEKTLSHGSVLVPAIPIGGLRMLDGNEADDKILAVMAGDAVYGGIREIGDCPKGLVERLRHYFLTYKQLPDAAETRVSITHVYGREEAYEVIAASRKDYEAKFGALRERLRERIG